MILGEITTGWARVNTTGVNALVTRANVIIVGAMLILLVGTGTFTRESCCVAVHPVIEIRPIIATRILFLIFIVLSLNLSPIFSREPYLAG